MANERQCEIKWCGNVWETTEGYDYAVICPKCGNSGYHMPERNEAHDGGK
jgi:hypothetical protein